MATTPISNADNAVREINRVDNTEAIQTRTLEVLTSIQGILAKQSGTSASGTSPRQKSPTPQSSSNRNSAKSSGSAENRVYGESHSEFQRRIQGEMSAGEYMHKEIVSKIAFALKPLESFLGWNLKLLFGRGLINIKNAITHTSEMEREIKKQTKKREKAKIEELNEEMRLAKKHLKQIGVNWKTVGVQDEHGKFKSREGMTDYQVLKSLTAQKGYKAQMIDAQKSKRQLQIEAMMGITDNNTVGSSGVSHALGGGVSGSSAYNGGGAKHDGDGIKQRTSPTLNDVSKTASGQAMIWYMNATKIGGKGKGGAGEDSGGLHFGIGEFLSGALGIASLKKLLVKIAPFFKKLLLKVFKSLPLLLIGVLVEMLKSPDIAPDSQQGFWMSKEDKLTEEYKKKFPKKDINDINQMVHKEIVRQVGGDEAYTKIISEGEKVDDNYKRDKMGALIFNSKGEPIKKNANELNKKSTVDKTPTNKQTSSDNKNDKSQKVKSVKDVIITKSGQVIETSPNDNIYATTKDFGGFDGDMKSSLSNMNKASGNSDNPIVKAITDQTNMLKDKLMGNIINNSTNSSSFGFDRVRMGMAYGKGGL